MMKKITNYLITLYNKYKLTFYSGAFFAFFNHLYFFMHRLGNEDDLNSFVNNGRVITSGRWVGGDLITTASIIPIVKFALVILALTLISVLICDLFQLKSKKSMILVPLLISTFPSLAMSFSYTFMVEVYIMALFTSILAIYFTVKNKKLLFISSILISFSLGYYQSYIGVASALAVIYLIKMCLDKEKVQNILKMFLRLLIMGLIGVCLYFVILKIILFINHTELSSYKGANEMGIPPIKNWPFLLIRTYKHFIAYYLGVMFFEKSTYKIILHFGILLLSAIILIKKIVKEKIYKEKALLLLLILLFIILPLATNIVDFMAFGTDITILNIYQFCLPFVLVVYILEKNTFNESNYLNTFLLILLLLFSWHNFIETNRYYLKNEEFYEYTYALNNRVLMRIEETPNYTYDMPVMMVGEFDSSFYKQLNNLTPWDNMVNYDQSLWGRYLGYTDLYYFTEYKVLTFINNQLGVELKSVSPEQREKILNTKEYQELKNWPNNDCIKIINDVLVLKF